MDRRHKLVFLENSKGIIKLNNEIGNIFVLSDEEIKEGDWVWKVFDNEIYCGKPVGTEVSLINELREDYKKIIATTDPSLKQFIKHDELNGNPIERLLPRPSDSFIQKYIENYNKGNIIEEVLVEYDREWDENGRAYYNTPYILKVAPDNTITIKHVKETWEDIWNKSLHQKYGEYFFKYLKENYNVPTKLK